MNMAFGSKKRKLHKMGMDEISPVDSPAQKPARIALTKREAPPKLEEFWKGITFEDVMTEMESCAQINEAVHDIFRMIDALQSSTYRVVSEEVPDVKAVMRENLQNFANAIVGRVAYAIQAIEGKVLTKVEDNLSFTATDYAYVAQSDNPTTWQLRLNETPAGKPSVSLVKAAVEWLSPDGLQIRSDIPSEAASGIIKNIKQVWHVTASELPAVLKGEEMSDNKELAELKAANERMTKLLTLNDEQRSFFAKLDEKDQEEFLKATPEQRIAQVRATAEQNPVIYKSSLGHEFRKNDDPRLVELAKTADAGRKENEELRKKAENSELLALAKSDYKFLPGSEETRVEMLRAIKAIPDETRRAEALTALRAQNDALAKALNTLGHVGDGPASGDKAELEKRTRDLMKADATLTFEKAQSRVLAQDPALYDKVFGKAAPLTV